MLKVISIDSVRLHWTISRNHAGLFMGQLHEIADHHHVEVKTINATHKSSQWGFRIWLIIEGKRLQLGVMRCYGSAWIEYGFKGIPDIQKFDTATILFSEWSFGNAIAKANVHRFEMAVDYSGLMSTQFISHYRGSRKSWIAQNKKSSGQSQYSGSVFTGEFVLYDKAQEVTDKGGTPICGNLLRMELRLHKKKETLLQILDDVVKSDPFQNVYVIQKERALKYKTKIENWPLFISACTLYGTAIALQKFSKNRKPFLKYLKALSDDTLRPCLQDFYNSFNFIFDSWKKSDCGIAMCYGIEDSNQLHNSSQHTETLITAM